MRSSIFAVRAFSCNKIDSSPFNPLNDKYTNKFNRKKGHKQNINSHSYSNIPTDDETKHTYNQKTIVIALNQFRQTAAKLYSTKQIIRNKSQNDYPKKSESSLISQRLGYWCDYTPEQQKIAQSKKFIKSFNYTSLTGEHRIKEKPYTAMRHHKYYSALHTKRKSIKERNAFLLIDCHNGRYGANCETNKKERMISDKFLRLKQLILDNNLNEEANIQKCEKPIKVSNSPVRPCFPDISDSKTKRKVILLKIKHPTNL